MSTAALPRLVPIAFLTVVLVWSTTPLGIVWSSESIHPTMAVLLRMLIALVFGVIILLLARIRLPWTSAACKLYSFSAIGIVGGMLLSYFAAKYLASGTMSLIFGLSPLLSGLIAQRLLGEGHFGVTRILAFAMSFTGLAIVCSSKLSIDGDSWIGLLLVLIAVVLFSLSGVLIKTVKINIHPLASTVGALLFSTPLFALAWLIFDGNLAIETWQSRSILAVVYLGVFGSLLGFIAYFYVLQHLAPSTVALVTLITPVFAMLLGAQLNNETLSPSLILGAGFVLSGLALYQFGQRLLKLFWQPKSANSANPS